MQASLFGGLGSASRDMEDAAERATLKSDDVAGRDGVEMGRPFEAKPLAAESSEEGQNDLMAGAGQDEGDLPGFNGRRTAPGNWLFALRRDEHS